MRPVSAENVLPFPRSCDEPEDGRFRSLAGAAAWERLPRAVRSRFGKIVRGGSSAVYAGEVVECRMNPWGRTLALLARLIGGPLPLSRDCHLAASVSVTEDAASGGQFWTRIYGRRRGFPQVIHSCKRFSGPTGLEEYLGCGFGIALVVAEQSGALHFLSDHYFFAAFGLRIRIPRALEPGRMRVSHIECNHGWFAFVLQLDHPLLGEMIRQTVLFREFRPVEA